MEIWKKMERVFFLNTVYISISRPHFASSPCHFHWAPYRAACYTYSEYLIRRYFVFVTNESDVRTTELRTEYLFISVQS